MALIKCNECGKEMSDHAKQCPNCGCDNNIMFCPECDKQLSRKASSCPNCGFAFKTNNNNGYTDERRKLQYGFSLSYMFFLWHYINS